MFGNSGRKHRYVPGSHVSKESVKGLGYVYYSAYPVSFGHFAQSERPNSLLQLRQLAGVESIVPANVHQNLDAAVELQYGLGSP